MMIKPEFPRDESDSLNPHSGWERSVHEKSPEQSQGLTKQNWTSKTEETSKEVEKKNNHHYQKQQENVAFERQENKRKEQRKEKAHCQKLQRDCLLYW